MTNNFWQSLSNDCIGVWAGKFLEVRRIIARILPNLPEKKLQKMWSPKKTSWAQFVSNQNRLSAIFAHLFWEFAQIFTDFVKVFKDFARIYMDFARILRDFAPWFSPNENFWRCAGSPCNPASYTSEWLHVGVFTTKLSDKQTEQSIALQLSIPSLCK